MLIPGPDTRVVELRVHGILGTTPQDLLETVAAVDVAGDGVGRIVRPADRLRRPAPGPVLKADGRPLPRTLEGYVWGAMTSGGAAKAIWALLFPFSLANVSYWMLPPMPEGSRPAHALGVCCRALLRLASLLLTMLLIGQLAVVSLDLLAAQCLAPGARCLTGVGDSFRTLPVVRPAIGVLPVLLVVWIVNRISTVNWAVRPGTRSGTTPLPSPPRRPRKLSGLPGADLVADPDASALRSLHVIAALATVALLGFGGPFRPAPGLPALACWSLAAALLLGCLLGTLVFGNPTGAHPGRSGTWLRRGLTTFPRRLLMTVAGLLVLALLITRPAGPLPGTEPTVDLTAGLLAAACVLLALLLIPSALLARRQWAGLPRELRPWAGGWLAAPFMALAALLGGGFGAGIGITVRQALGGRTLTLPAGYAHITLLWGIAAVLAALAGVIGLGVTKLTGALAHRGGRGVPPEVPLLHADRPQDEAKALDAWRTANWSRRHAQHVLLTLAAVLCAGAAGAIVLRLHRIQPPLWTEPLSAVGVVALGLLAAALLREVYRAARKPDSARRLGGLSDLCCFWPREAHPMVPPCYALKVVPELAGRAAEHLAEPNTRVVLTGHSQGSVLVCVAASRLLESLPPDQRERLGIVLAGCPIQWAYSRAFPGVLPHDGLNELFTDLGGRWRTLCRGTDPIGGGMSTWDRQVFDGRLIGVGFHADGTVGALPPAVAGPTGALVLGGDHWCPDPERGPFPGRRWTPGVQRHGDYYSDPEWDRAVACAAGMESPAHTPTQPVLFRLPGRPTAPLPH